MYHDDLQYHLAVKVFALDLKLIITADKVKDQVETFPIID